jgi:UDP-N-acetyl-2-amino-2-deoxyglucuronate dehydrogenase
MSMPLKVGLIGTGSISWYHLTAYNQYPDTVRLTAVCDIRRDAMEEFAKKANVGACYDDYHRMLHEADIDAVDICTSHDQHEPQVLAAATAGKHVLLEKPMGRNMQECRNMVAATAKAGVTFMIGHDLRYMPHSLAIKRIIDSGELGAVRVTRCVLISNMAPMPPGGGDYKLGAWLSDAKLAGGGIMISGVIHQVDLLRYYIGDIKSVIGVCRSVHPQFLNGAEEYGCATLEFENGAIGDILIIASPTRSPLGCQYTLYGDEGTIYSTQAGNRTYQFAHGMISSRNRQKPGDAFNSFVPIEPVTGPLAGDDPFVNEILHFAGCCRAGKTPLTGGKDNLGTVKAIFGIYESSRTGKKVDLSTL